MNEFDMIQRYFTPLALGDLKDDAAILNIPQGQELVVSTDILNENIHFMKGELPHYIAHKALRTNLSDLAAMGAQPYAYQLGLALPQSCDEAWIKSFAAALKEDQEAFGLKLSGGDTTTTNGPLSVSITIMGLVPKGKAVKRSGAQAEDILLTTGYIGDAFIGLKILKGEIKTQDDSYFIERYHRPSPRTALCNTMQSYAKAAADISDGFVADLGHIAEASGLKASVSLEDVQFSPQAQAVIAQGQVSSQELLTVGDDYELLLAVSPHNAEIFREEAKKTGIHIHPVGVFKEGRDVEILGKDKEKLHFTKTGWQHF